MCDEDVAALVVDNGSGKSATPLPYFNPKIILPLEEKKLFKIYTEIYESVAFIFN